MVEEQVDIEGLPINFELYLAPDKGESAAELQQRVSKMLEERTFELPLFRLS